MKKLIVVGIIFLLVGMSISSTGINIENRSLLIKRFETQPCYFESEISKLVKSIKNPLDLLLPDNYIIYDTDYDDFHPTVAGNANNVFLACFELTLEEVDWFPDFWYSLDEGMTWDESGYFPDSLGAKCPDLDSNENGFYGTFGIPPEENLGEQWLVIAEDLMTITGAVWDWSPYGFDDFYSMAISCHSQPEIWNFGGMAGTGYNGYAGDWKGNPFISYPTSETGGTIAWLDSSTGYLNADFAIDEETGMSYAVYDHETDANLLVRKDNFGVYDGDGRHPYVRSYLLGDSATKISMPSVEAHDDNVVIVAEVDGGIDCFYSSNGGTTTFQTDVANSATNPEVMTTWDGEVFICSYVKSGGIYRKMSENGGATWTDEKLIEHGTTTGNSECHDMGKALGGVYSVWESPNGDIDIYFGNQIGDPPLGLYIKSISGGIGITATVKNSGIPQVTNVEWMMSVKGGLLGMINKEKTGTEETLADGCEFNIKSRIILGIGKITVGVEVTSDEGDSDSKTKIGRQILYFSLL